MVGHFSGFTEKDVSVVIFSAHRRRKSGARGWRGGLRAAGAGAMIGCLLGVVFGSQWRFGPVATGTAGLLLVKDGG